MRISVKPFEIYVSLYLLPVIGFFILTGYVFEYLAAFFSIVLHELGHVLAAAGLGFGLRSVRLLPSGLSVSLEDAFCTRRDSIIICAAGPLVNLALAILATAVLMFFPAEAAAGCKGYFSFFSLSNLYLAVFNLIPATPLDGGRILQELLSDRFGLIRADRSLRRLAAAFSLLFVLLGIYQIFHSRINFTLFVIGFYMMLLLISGRTEAALMNMKQIVFRRSRFLKKGTYPARVLVTLKTTLLCSILKEMDHDCFHLVHVLDENLKTMAVLNENEILESIVKYNSDMSFGELLERNSGNG